MSEDSSSVGYYHCFIYLLIDSNIAMQEMSWWHIPVDLVFFFILNYRAASVPIQTIAMTTNHRLETVWE